MGNTFCLRINRRGHRQRFIEGIRSAALSCKSYSVPCLAALHVTRLIKVYHSKTYRQLLLPVNFSKAQTLCLCLKEKVLLNKVRGKVPLFSLLRRTAAIKLILSISISILFFLACLVLVIYLNYYMLYTPATAVQAPAGLPTELRYSGNLSISQKQRQQDKKRKQALHLTW